MIRNVNRSPLSSVLTASLLASCLVACSTVDSVVSGDKIDYRSATAKATPLEVPPDLPQLAIDPRYAPQAGVISAAAQQAAGAASAPTTSNLVAPQSMGGLRIEREGNLRYLSTPMAPEQLWPQLQEFWKERNLTLVLDQAEVGVMETGTKKLTGVRVG